MLNGLDVTLNAAQGNRDSIFLFSFGEVCISEKLSQPI